MFLLVCQAFCVIGSGKVMIGVRDPTVHKTGGVTSLDLFVDDTV